MFDLDRHRQHWERMVAIAPDKARAFRECLIEGANCVRLGLSRSTYGAIFTGVARNNGLVDALGGVDALQITIAEALEPRTDAKSNGHGQGKTNGGYKQPHGGPHQSKPSDDADLLAMNAAYAVVKIGGKTRIMSLEESPVSDGCKVPVFSTIQDFTSFHFKRKKIRLDAKGSPHEIGIGKWWVEHKDRRQYDGVVYAPGGATANMFNLWSGFACEAKEGACDLYLTHLKENVCGGDDGYCEYLLNWMAYAVQNPGKPGEVAVVMRGKEGVGKGVAAKEFGYLFGPHFRHVVHAQHLVGHFNSHLQQCSVLYADEAFFAGNRSHEGTLKALITEGTFLVEPKGVDSFPVRNCIHLLMSSNGDWVVPAGAEARRYFVLNVSDTRMQDSDYFSAITRQMNNGGRSALLFVLQERDLSDFNVRQVPQTDALAEQKAHSRRGVDLLVEILANDGTLPSSHMAYPNIAITSGEADGKGFHVAARNLAADLKHSASTVIVAALKKNWGCKSWESHGKCGIEFPKLADLRALFDRKHGPQEWPERKDWEVAS
jgi:Family of unknown function (DUF5906)